MELESQIMADSSIMYPETVFYDIFSQNYPVLHYKNADSEDPKLSNNNMNKSDMAVSSLEVLNRNMEHMVKYPVNIMPPPKVNYNNNVVKRYQPRESSRPRDNYRPISPKGYDSDESCTSYTSSSGTHLENGES